MSGARRAEVAVLGGGLVGTSVAYELACAGIGVALIDATHVGRASDAGAGIVSPDTFHDDDTQWVGFGQSAARHLSSLVARLAEDGVDPGTDAFAECGSLVVALAEHEGEWFDQVLEKVTARQVGAAEISAGDARELFPPLGRVTRALYSPRAARVDGRALCNALRVAAARRGAVALEMEAVGIETDAGRVTAVRSENDLVQCAALVLAGGAWSAGAARWLGVELPVTPMKGQIVHVRLPGHEGRAETVDSGRWPIVQPVANFYLVPWAGGRVACGGTFEAAAGFDARPTASGLRDLLRECVAIAPGLAEATFVEVRVGLRPTSADDRPLLGLLPGWENVHVCTGHGANGLLMGPYSGSLVAAGMQGEASPDLALYSAARPSRRS